MKNSVFICLIVMTGACSNDVTTDAAQEKGPGIDFEKRLILPSGAADIGDYNRYYYFSGDRIAGEFVRAESGRGRVVIVQNPAALPHMEDGGCDVINLEGDRRHIERAKISCNGDA